MAGFTARSRCSGRAPSSVPGSAGFATRIVVVTSQIAGSTASAISLALDFNGRRNTRVRAVFAEESLSTGSRPFYGRQQETIATAQREQLLLGTSAETLRRRPDRDSFGQRGRYDFRRPRRTRYQSTPRSVPKTSPASDRR